MECPFIIEPHQIQGLDHKNIFPVVQWLVKRALETRAQREESNRHFAVGQYQINHKVKDLLPRSLEAECPKRLLQQKNPLKVKDDKVRVKLTLLEYSNKELISRQGKDTTDSEHSDLEEMSLAKETKVVNEDALGSLVQVEKLGTAGQEFRALGGKKSDYDDNSLEGLQASILQLESVQSKLSGKIAEMAAKCHNMEEEHMQTEAHVANVQRRIDGIQGQMAVAVNNDQDRILLTKLKKLIDRNEEIKKADRDLKESCRQEMTELKDKIAGEKARLAEFNVGVGRGAVLAPQEAEQLAELRQELADKSRELLEVERRIDSVPSREELSQYQKRIIELHNQISSKHIEVQSFFDMFNNLGDQKVLIEQEIMMMSEIEDKMATSWGYLPNRISLLAQAEKYLKDVEDATKKVEVKLTDAEALREEQLRKRGQQLSVRNTYMQLLHKITMELRKCELMQEKLSQK